MTDILALHKFNTRGFKNIAKIIDGGPARLEMPECIDLVMKKRQQRHKEIITREHCEKVIRNVLDL